MTNDAAVVRYDPWIRYDLDTNGTPCMERILYGDYVRVEDYWALATTVAELRDNAAKWKSLHDAMVLVCDVQARRIGRMTAQLEAAERRVAEAESVCRAVLGTFQRNLASEEACGQPFMGDDEHEAIRLLTKLLTKESPLRQEKPE